MKLERVLDLMWIPLLLLVAFALGIMNHQLNEAELTNAVLKAKLEVCRCAPAAIP